MIHFTSTAIGTRQWTNRFRSAITTIVSSSSQSHMVHPVWIKNIQPQRKATPTFVLYMERVCATKIDIGVS